MNISKYFIAFGYFIVNGSLMNHIPTTVLGGDSSRHKRQRTENKSISAVSKTKDNAKYCVEGWTLPYSPYTSQVQIIETLSTALHEGSHCIVESPTGTGKTLALLCATLHYHSELRKKSPMMLKQVIRSRVENRESEHQLPITIRGANRLKKAISAPRNPSLLNTELEVFCGEEENGDSLLESGNIVPPIFYASRTHSQLAQAVSELRKMSRGSVHMNLLAGRNQYCVNERVRTSLPHERNNLGEMCDKAVLLNQCSSWEGYDALAELVSSKPHEWNIEDLIQEGKSQDGCPYYASRELVNTAYITFCPYNYLLNPLIRHETKIEGRIRHSVVVFDEAHNIEEVSRSSLDCLLFCEELSVAIDEIEPFIGGRPLHYTKSFGFGKYLLADACGLVVRIMRSILEVVQTWSIGNHAVKKLIEKFSFLGDIATKKEETQLFHATLKAFLKLGVTFNPFDAAVSSIHTSKNVLVFLHLAIYRPRAFTVLVRKNREKFEAFCSDSSLAFQLLAQERWRYLFSVRYIGTEILYFF